MTADWDSRPRRRRRGALRGLSALPVPRQLAQEPDALAVRGARTRRAPPTTASARTTRCPHRSSSRRGQTRRVSVVVRFLQLQHRGVEKDTGGGRFEPVDELVVGLAILAALGRGRRTRDLVRADRHRIEACRRPFRSRSTRAPTSRRSTAAGWSAPVVRYGRELDDRRRTRRRVRAPDDGGAQHRARPPTTKTRRSPCRSIGTHLVAEITNGDFVSLLEPPASADSAVARCRHHRCFPVLAGPSGDHALMLVSPIILYDHPEIAEQSEGALYDSTEIDEILTLRIMTMTDEEKAAGPRHRSARRADHRPVRLDVARGDAEPARRAAQSACRRTTTAGLIPEIPEGVDWWDPLADNAVAPDVDAVLVNGVRVSRGSRVRLHPSRRADAQDLFFAGKIARVTSVHETVDGDQHVGVVIEDDPAADLHEWYGRYLYFAPDEVEPLSERNPTCKQ